MHRREYNVPGPHHLWHFDANLKLVEYGLFIHSCVDGFSRCVLYIYCADNNRSVTLARQFYRAVRQYGVPSRARCDKGSENRRASKFLLSVRGLGRGSVIVSKSVHNQRVERMWRDVLERAADFYRDLFAVLRNQLFYNFKSPIVKFCLHYLFLPRINETLTEFMNSWNNHKLSTARYRTPKQLLILYAGDSAAMTLSPPQYVWNPVTNREEDVNGVPYSVLLGTDQCETPEAAAVLHPPPDNVLLANNNHHYQEVHPINCPLFEAQYQLFTQHFQPFSLYDPVTANYSGEDMIAIFEEAVSFCEDNFMH